MCSETIPELDGSAIQSHANSSDLIKNVHMDTLAALDRVLI